MSGGDWKEMLFAVQNGDIELVKYHISSGVDPNYEHPELVTNALIECVQFERLEIAKYLLENGADPNQKAWMSTENAMKVAKNLKRLEFVKLFKEHSKKRRLFW